MPLLRTFDYQRYPFDGCPDRRGGFVSAEDGARDRRAIALTPQVGLQGLYARHSSLTSILSDPDQGEQYLQAHLDDAIALIDGEGWKASIEREAGYRISKANEPTPAAIATIERWATGYIEALIYLQAAHSVVLDVVGQAAIVGIGVRAAKGEDPGSLPEQRLKLHESLQSQGFSSWGLELERRKNEIGLWRTRW